MDENELILEYQYENKRLQHLISKQDTDYNNEIISLEYKIDDLKETIKNLERDNSQLESDLEYEKNMNHEFEYTIRSLQQELDEAESRSDYWRNLYEEMRR